MRSFSIALLLTIFSASTGLSLAAQEAKKDAPKAEPAKTAAPVEAPKAEPAKEAPKAEPAKEEPKKVEEAPLKPITPAVEAKLEAARKAIAELIVEAEDAGLVETTITQPPVLDLLITGRATDLRELKKPAAERSGVSPEVFGAWFTGNGKSKEALGGLEIKPQSDVRIFQPTKGLSDYFEKRSNILNTYVAQARAAKAADLAKKVEEAQKAEAAKKAEEAKKAEAAKKAAEPKKEEVKKEEPKKEEAPKAEPKKEEPKKEEVKKEEPKKEEAPKAEPKKEEVKKEEPKKEEAKKG